MQLIFVKAVQDQLLRIF